MNRFFLGLLGMMMLTLFAKAQILEPVKWSFKVEQPTPEEATLVMTAQIDKTWHLYSQYIPTDKEGPLPTTFSFTKTKDFQLIGKVRESKPIEENDPNFGIVLKFFADKAVFKQKIKVLSPKDFVVNGVVNFMCCDDKQCLPPSDVEFEFKLKGNPAAAEYI